MTVSCVSVVRTATAVHPALRPYRATRWVRTFARDMANATQSPAHANVTATQRTDIGTARTAHRACGAARPGIGWAQRARPVPRHTTATRARRFVWTASSATGTACATIRAAVVYATPRCGPGSGVVQRATIVPSAMSARHALNDATMTRHAVATACAARALASAHHTPTWASGIHRQQRCPRRRPCSATCVSRTTPALRASGAWTACATRRHASTARARPMERCARATPTRRAASGLATGASSAKATSPVLLAQSATAGTGALCATSSAHGSNAVGRIAATAPALTASASVTVTASPAACGTPRLAARRVFPATSVPSAMHTATHGNRAAGAVRATPTLVRVCVTQTPPQGTGRVCPAVSVRPHAALVPSAKRVCRITTARTARRSVTPP
eukprot:PhM_4_TR14681/c2_g1_i1/m.16619